MASLDSEIDDVLDSNTAIAREQVIEWINDANDLTTLSRLYRLTDEGYYRITPELGMDATCGLILRYLLECIRQNIKNDDAIQSRFEAAASLHLWLRHLSDAENTASVITRAARAITDLFLSDEATQDTIETGFLEHALESAALRPYFDFWASDDRLRPAWERALEWGRAHPDYMWNLLQSRGKLETD